MAGLCLANTLVIIIVIVIIGIQCIYFIQVSETATTSSSAPMSLFARLRLLDIFRHVTRKTVSKMTYNVSSGTLNSTISISSGDGEMCT